MATVPALVLTADRDPGVRLLTLNRPERRNALSMALLAELADAIEAADRDPAVRCIVLRGAGPVFCAGLDLREAVESNTAHASAGHVARALTVLHNSPKITIAAVHGAALAGGAGLMTCCDFVVAAEGTLIGYPEVRRGLVAALVLSFLLHRIREADARELVLLGEGIDATKALAIGLVNRVVPPDEIVNEALALAGHIALGAPQALAHTKELLNALRPRPVSEDLDLAREVHAAARASGEAQEGIAAFLEKRQPRWSEEHSE
ncbi:MAG: enoyl-CoA hydratase/isomerase family protein, partial [FCB group bacterium]|nr:enoyl-CoA hydratase/isomerase family protein [FCB group bacterium]